MVLLVGVTVIADPYPDAGDEGDDGANYHGETRAPALGGEDGHKGEEETGEVSGEGDDGDGVLKKKLAKLETVFWRKSLGKGEIEYLGKKKVVLEIERHVDLADVDEHSGGGVDDGQFPEAERGEPLSPALLVRPNQRLSVLDAARRGQRLLTARLEVVPADGAASGAADAADAAHRQVRVLEVASQRQSAQFCLLLAVERLGVLQVHTGEHCWQRRCSGVFVSFRANCTVVHCWDYCWVLRRNGGLLDEPVEEERHHDADGADDVRQVLMGNRE